MGTELLMERYRDEHSHLLGLEPWEGMCFSLPNSENYLWHRVGASETLAKINRSWLENKKLPQTGSGISQYPGGLFHFLEGREGTISPHFTFSHLFPSSHFLSFLPASPLLFSSFPLLFIFLSSASTEQKLPGFGFLGINQHRETPESVA